MERCVVLNGDYSYLNVVSWKRAVCLMFKGKAEVLKWSDREIRNCEGKVITKVPLVLRIFNVSIVAQKPKLS